MSSFQGLYISLATIALRLVRDVWYRPRVLSTVGIVSIVTYGSTLRSQIKNVVRIGEQTEVSRQQPRSINQVDLQLSTKVEQKAVASGRNNQSHIAKTFLLSSQPRDVII